MNPPRLLRVLLAVALCLAVAGTAAAATSAPGPRKYTGRTGQTNPKTGKKYPLRFQIANGKVSRVHTFTRDKCPDGTFLRVEQNAFKSATLDSKGRFTLVAGTTQQPAVMKGTVSGSKASGTIRDRTNDPATPSSGICKGRTTWTAKLAKP
jgi:hypothetical protein